jgi:hypothetical protein
MKSYCWYEPVYHAIKIGMGDDPIERMQEYARRYGLRPDKTSLRTSAMPSYRIARVVEKTMHDHLDRRALNRLPIRDANHCVAEEIFGLYTNQYSSIADDVCDVAEHRAFELCGHILRFDNRPSLGEVQYNAHDKNYWRRRPRRWSTVLALPEDRPPTVESIIARSNQTLTRGHYPSAYAMPEQVCREARERALKELKAPAHYQPSSVVAASSLNS